MPQPDARRIGLRTHLHDAAVALGAYARGQTIRHRTAAVALRPGHAAVSRWLNPGLRRPGSPRRAGHGIAVLAQIGEKDRASAL